MSAPDVLYYDMTASQHGRGGRRRSRMPRSQHPQPLPVVPSNAKNMKELGIGTRTCFSFRVPRTITTSDMSEGEVSQAQLHHPNYERLEKRGLLQSSELKRSMMFSPSSQTTASMTATPASSPESNINSTPTSRGSLLVMPTPKDRSHQRRLHLERGLGNTYDGEQEPAGYRGQEAVSGRTPDPTPTNRSRHIGARDLRTRIANEGDNVEGQSSAMPSPPTPAHLLAMPTPKDRSHRRRLQMEREGTGYSYEGEQKPADYRGQPSNLPRAVSPELSLSRTSHSISKPNSRTQHLRQRIERERPSREEEKDPVAHLFSETDMILDNVVRNAKARTRNSRQDVNDDPAHDTRTGSPYLQFSPEGPAIRGIEPNRQQIRLTSSNSSLAVSENASIASDDHIRLMVSDLVPLSPTSEKQVVSRASTTARESIQKNRHQRMRPIPRTPTRSRGYGTETTEASSTPGTREPPTRSRKKQEDSQEIAPEKIALAILRSGSQDSSLCSNSTHSSENLRSMMGDLLVDAGDNSSLPSQTGKTRTLPDTNEMALAAQKHAEEGEYDIALVLLGRVLDIYQTQHGPRHPLVASAYHNLGMVHAQRSDLLLEGTLQQTHVRQQALECFQRAARTARDSLGKNHPNVAVSLVKIGFLLLQARQFDPALVTFEEALRIRAIHYASNPHHPLIANLHNNIGMWKEKTRLASSDNSHTCVLFIFRGGTSSSSKFLRVETKFEQGAQYSAAQPASQAPEVHP